MSSVRYWLILAAVLGAVYASFALRRAHTDSELAKTAAREAAAEMANAPSEPLDQFTLTDQAGQPFNSDSLRGKVWVASFFFTNCPAVCWRLNQALAAIQQESPDSQVRYVSISCDPDNDTVEALAKYAEHFHADPKRWTFLTGNLDLICKIGKDFFKISVEKAGHTDRACVVDRQGKVRGRFRLTQPDQVEMLKKLIAQVEAEPADSPATAADGAATESNAQQPAESQPATNTPATDAPATDSATPESAASEPAATVPE